MRFPHCSIGRGGIVHPQDAFLTGRDYTHEQMIDRQQRVIAALEVEASMTETHARSLRQTASSLVDAKKQKAMLGLAQEEADKAASIRRHIHDLQEQTRSGAA
jgi:hypothetical protein